MPTSGAANFPLAGQVPGTSTNDNSAAGKVGEVILSTVAVSTVSLSTGTAANITSISLTAGDWDVYGLIDYHPGGSTTASYLQGGISQTSGTLGSQETIASDPFAIAAGLGVDPGIVVPPQRVNLASTTTVYLVAKAGFALSTLTGGGILWARRAR